MNAVRRNLAPIRNLDLLKVEVEHECSGYDPAPMVDYLFRSAQGYLLHMHILYHDPSVSSSAIQNGLLIALEKQGDRLVVKQIWIEPETSSDQFVLAQTVMRDALYRKIVALIEERVNSSDEDRRGLVSALEGFQVGGERDVYVSTETENPSLFLPMSEVDDDHGMVVIDSISYRK